MKRKLFTILSVVMAIALSVIRFVRKDGRVSRLRQLGIRETPPESGVTLSVGTSRFHWDHPSATHMIVPSTPREKLLTTSPVFTDNDQFELLKFPGMKGVVAAALHVAIRRLPERRED